MNIPNLIQPVEYPTSDGMPMGETDLHHSWMERILELLRYRYRGQQVYVSGNLLVYYAEGKPTRFVVPDCMVVLQCDPGERRNYKLWEEPSAPHMVLEVTSDSTAREDLINKPLIYEQIGVHEYFLYDPSGTKLRPALQGFRLRLGVLERIEPCAGQLTCESLGIRLRLTGKQLELVDTQSESPLLTEAEAERAARRAEEIRRAVAEARIADLEAKLRRYEQS